MCNDQSICIYIIFPPNTRKYPCERDIPDLMSSCWIAATLSNLYWSCSPTSIAYTAFDWNLYSKTPNSPINSRIHNLTKPNRQPGLFNSWAASSENIRPQLYHTVWRGRWRGPTSSHTWKAKLTQEQSKSTTHGSSNVSPI